MHAPHRCIKTAFFVRFKSCKQKNTRTSYFKTIFTKEHHRKKRFCFTKNNNRTRGKSTSQRTDFLMLYIEVKKKQTGQQQNRMPFVQKSEAQQPRLVLLRVF